MTPPLSRTLVLALGSNAGAPMRHMQGAVAALAEALDDLSVSNVYRTPPEHGEDQPDYWNAVARGAASLSPRQALALAHDLERDQGRTRPYPGAPRTLDVDVLFLGDAVVDEPGLRIPHPRWRARGFVLVPLLDVAPDWVDPETGRTVASVAAEGGWSRASFPIAADAAQLLEVESP